MPRAKERHFQSDTRAVRLADVGEPPTRHNPNPDPVYVDAATIQRGMDVGSADTERQLPRFIGLSQPDAEALGQQLGIEPWFNDADNPLPERLIYRSRGVRLCLRDGVVAWGEVG